MIAVRFHSEAEAEILDAEQWYRERSDAAAQAFSLAVDHAIAAVAEAPLRWPLSRRGERRFVLRRFPYSLIYRVRASHIFITAVAHHRRRPGYWLRRR
jgi:plasmid stabilization system protein ParE